MKKYIVLLCLLPVIAAGQNISIGKKQVNFAPGFPQMLKGGVEYAENFSLPASLPKTNLLGYWSYEYGINSDSTIYLVDANNTPVDTIKLSSVDFSLASGYIPLKTASTFTMQSVNDINTAFWDHDIYPTTVFQNIDYDSTTYFKVADHVLNADSTELHPARITEIAMYSQATDANSYFGVPSETANVYQSKDGNNSNGGTSWDDAVLTFAKSTTLMDNDKLAYIKSGDYVENAVILGHNVGIGNSEISVTSNTAITSNDTSIMEKFVIDGRNLYRYGVLYGSVDSAVIKNCYFKNTVREAVAIKSTSMSYIENSVFNNSGGTHGAAYVAGFATFDGCYFSGKVTSDAIFYNETTGELIVKHSTFAGETPLSVIRFGKEGSFTIHDNKFISDNYMVYVIYPFGILPESDVTITDNYIEIDSVDYSVIRATTDVAWDWNIQNNTIYTKDTLQYWTIQLYEQKSAKANNNILVNKTPDLPTGGIIFNSQSAPQQNFEISNNYISYYSAIAVINIDSIKVNNNRVICKLDTVDNASIFQQSNVYEAKYNKFNEAFFHLGYAYCRFDNELVCGYNVMINPCFNALTDLGSSKVLYHNNTIIRNSEINGRDYEYFGIFIEEWDATGTPTDSARVINNIFIYDGEEIPGNRYYHVFVEQESCLDGFECDYNIYYSTKANQKMWKIVNTEYTFAEWQALGYDTHSILITDEAEMKALFTDYDNGDYSLAIGSTAIGSGKNLGVAYDDGLDISTTWGSSTTVPNIVTKQQGATWQIGAYVQ